MKKKDLSPKEAVAILKQSHKKFEYQRELSRMRNVLDTPDCIYDCSYCELQQEKKLVAYRIAKDKYKKEFNIKS
ncbi:MAG: hypothetical protein AABY22_19510 [Nanoarchaeota archaeon]